MIVTPSLANEYDDIMRDFQIRYEQLDEDLKAMLNPLSITKRDLKDLFIMTIYYPEIPNHLNGITFRELSNECMKKIISEVVYLSFTRVDGDDEKMELTGNSENGIKIKGLYYIPQER